MANKIKFTPDEVKDLLRKLMSDDQFEKCTQNTELIMTLANGYQSPLLDFTSRAKSEIVQLIQSRQEKQLPIDVDALMAERGEVKEPIKEKERIENVLSTLEAGEDPTKYKAKIRIKLSDPDVAGRQSILADMSFPRRELFVAETMKVGDYTVRLDAQQVEDLKTIGRLNHVVDGIDVNGVVRQFFVAKDPELNQLRFLDKEKVSLPPYVYGLKLPEETRQSLLQGKITNMEIKAKGDVKSVQAYFDPVTYKIKFVPESKDRVLRTEQSQAQINQINKQNTSVKEKRQPSKSLQNATKTGVKQSPQKQNQKRNQKQTL